MEKTKIIAMYLPQFHTIPENDKWWGKGYTDWTAVKNNKPLFEGHNQPRVPFNREYYSLTDIAAIRWQAAVAKQYGIDGFGIYHYWFSDQMRLLEKPAELILQNSDIDLSYMFIWDNASWKRTWSNVKSAANDWAPSFDKACNAESESNRGLLAELIYGEETSWEKHFEYLLPFFQDQRYIKKNNKPLFGFFAPYNNFDLLKRMCAYWDILAKKAGFDGILCISKQTHQKYMRLDHMFRYEPLNINTKMDLWKSRIHRYLNKKGEKLRVYKYDDVWEKILRNASRSGRDKLYYGGFVGYDDTPRRGKRGAVILGQTPEKFQKYLDQLYSISQSQGKEFIFLTAWNEWGEGAYLEPDTTDGYAYLEAVKAVKDKYEKNS